MRRMLLTAAVLCVVTPTGAAQPAAPLRFEVATIKPWDPDSKRGFNIEVYPGGRVLLTQYSLASLVGTAFRHSRAQITNNGAAWIEDAPFTVEAMPPASAGIVNLNHTLFDIDDERLRQMLQALLIERFQLKVRGETRTGEVYELRRTNKAFGLELAKIPEGRNPSSMATSIGYAGGRWVMQFVTMPELARFASSTVVRAPVVDLTNVSGSFDYRQQPELDPQYVGLEHAASFMRMIDSVGLELKRTRGPVETLVIDSAQRPTPN